MNVQTRPQSSSLHIVPFTGSVGAEIFGIDLAAPQPKSVWDEVRAAFTQYGVIFFRDQNLTEDQQMAFAEQFGTPAKEVFLRGMETHEKLVELRKEPHERDNAGHCWHADQSSRPHPVRATVLVAREVPESGGDTCFVHMGDAYDELSEGLKKTLEGLRALHSDKAVIAKAAASKDNYLSRAFNNGEVPESYHPVVIRVPETGRKILFVNPHKTMSFEGWTEEESRPLLNHLFQHSQRPEFACRFRWKAGSVAVWDNYQTWHYAVNDYHGKRRVMHRVTVMSEPFTA